MSLTNRWIRRYVSPARIKLTAKDYLQYYDDWMHYSNMPGAEVIDEKNICPQAHDRTNTTSVDSHYFYQDIWAFKAIKASGAQLHVDIGSRAIFVGMLTAISQVIFIDIRPLTVRLENFYSQSASILSLPFADNSVPSISCLHVAEHIGLGRYGDPLDPQGTKKAARELARVLAPQGNLYFSVPIGKPRVCFNAHRIHSPWQVLEYFHDLELVEFSGVDDEGTFKRGIAPEVLADARYACGLFLYRKTL